jgi:hypothetical protein
VGTGTRKSQYEKYFETVKKTLQEMQIDTTHYKIDLHYWNKFNELRDQGRPLSDIKTMAEIYEVTPPEGTQAPTITLFALEFARLCVMKYNGDEQKLRECLQGGM